MTTLTDTISTPAFDQALPGAAAGAPKLLLRLEGLAAFGMALLAYERTGGSWMAFAVLFLAPDLAMVGYLAGRRVGAITYNMAHSYLGPAALGAFGLIASSQTAVWLALIWVAHIGFDRALGYGLKYASAFGDTHLSRAGKQARD